MCLFCLCRIKSVLGTASLNFKKIIHFSYFYTIPELEISYRGLPIGTNPLCNIYYCISMYRYVLFH